MYKLQSINGAAPPASLFGTPQREVELLDGSVTLFDSGSYTTALIVRTTELGTVKVDTQTATGRYERNGNSLLFRSPPSSFAPSGGVTVVRVNQDGTLESSQWATVVRFRPIQRSH
jgi:hypothetical protein